MSLRLASLGELAHTGPSRAFPALQDPSGENGEPISCGFSAVRRPFFCRLTFFDLGVRKGLARFLPVGKLHLGTRNPSVGTLVDRSKLMAYSCAAGDGEKYNSPVWVNTPATPRMVTNPRHLPDGGFGPRKPVSVEAQLANLSARGGVSLPRLTLPRLSYHHGRLCWEFRCGHTAPVPKPFPPGVSVMQAARSTSCPSCAHMEALVARRRSSVEAAHV